MTNSYSRSDNGKVPTDWQTTAEATGYAKTRTYDEAISFSKRLAVASNGLMVYESYGKSGEGRDMPLLIAATGKAPLRDSIALAELTQLSLYWRDVSIAVLTEQANRLRLERHGACATGSTGRCGAGGGVVGRAQTVAS